MWWSVVVVLLYVVRIGWFLAVGPRDGWIGGGVLWFVLRVGWFFLGVVGRSYTCLNRQIKSLHSQCTQAFEAAEKATGVKKKEMDEMTVCSVYVWIHIYRHRHIYTHVSVSVQAGVTPQPATHPLPQSPPRHPKQAKHTGLKERVALIKSVEVDIVDQLEEYARVGKRIRIGGIGGLFLYVGSVD